MSYRLTKKKNYKFSYFGSQMFTFFSIANLLHDLFETAGQLYFNAEM